MNGSKVAAIPCGRTTIAQSNCRQLIGLRPGFASSIKRQRIQLNRTASIGPGSLPLLAKRNGRRLHEKFPSDDGCGGLQPSELFSLAIPLSDRADRRLKPIVL